MRTVTIVHMQLHSASPACMHQSHLAQDLAASSGAVEPAGGWEVVSAATARLRVGESGRQGGMGAWHVRHGSHVCEHGMSGVGVGASGGAPARLRPAEHGLYVNGLLAIYCDRRFVTMFFSAIIH